MSKLISSKEAKLAWANGQEVEFYSEGLDTWFSLNDDVFLSDVFDVRKLRLKPKTILINGVEVPALFKPKISEFYYCISPFDGCGYTKYRKEDNYGYGYDQFGAWRTEDEIKQVVEVLRNLFNQVEAV